VTLAIFLDPIGERPEAPVFPLLDRAALAFELGGDCVGNGFDLLLRDIVACNEHTFIKWHVWSLWLEAQDRA
jgi:hypothetical protein